MFKLFDDDGSGSISEDEFQHALNLLGLEISRRDIEAIFSVLDADNSGSIEISEFQYAWFNRGSVLCRDTIRGDVIRDLQQRYREQLHESLINYRSRTSHGKGCQLRSTM